MPQYSNEEEIKIHLVIPWLEQLGYKRETLEFGKTITINEGRKTKSIFADIVIYTDQRKTTPLVVVDTKSPNEILTKNDKEQVISYARLLPKIAPIAILANGTVTQVYQTLDKSRIKDLPRKTDVLNDFVGAVLSKSIQDALREEATKKLFTIDDVSVFKDLLKRCHNIIRNNEGYDPIQAFDEMSKVLFAKMYEEQFHRESNRFTYDLFEKALKDLNVNIVQQQFSEIQKVEAYKELFPPNTKIHLKDRTIKEIVRIFEKYDLTLTDFDVKGEAFEYFLGDTFTGGLGEYFTPRNVVEFIVESVSPKIGDKMVDPFCGTGGFLIYAFEVVSEKIKLQDFADEEKKKWKRVLSDESLFGTDWKHRTSQACKMNMIVHGDGNTGVFQHDGFRNVDGKIFEDKFDLCLTNPPFGANETDEEVLKRFELGNGRSSQKREVLAIERCLKLVKPNRGVVAFILPDGVLNGDRYSYVREFIHREADVLAIIGLNKETFEGYNATVKTSIVMLRRKTQPDEEITKSIFMAVCTNSGYAPNGLQVPGNQLPEILFDLKNFLRNSAYQPVYKQAKIVRLQSTSVRLDSEHYIAINDTANIGSPEVVSWNLLNQLKQLSADCENINSSLKKNYKAEEFDHVNVDAILSPVENKISLKKDEEYRSCGVRGKGDGVFVKKILKGDNHRSTRLNQVEENWFVYSRLFAKNGSFAFVKSEFAGGLFSSEFPTFQVVIQAYETEDLLEYLVFYFSSPQVLSKINRSTTGSIKQSRARFKEEQFLAMRVPIPKEESTFLEIVSSIREIKELRKSIKDLSSRINDLPFSFQHALPFIIE